MHIYHKNDQQEYLDNHVLASFLVFEYLYHPLHQSHRSLKWKNMKDLSSEIRSGNRCKNKEKGERNYLFFLATLNLSSPSNPRASTSALNFPFSYISALKALGIRSVLAEKLFQHALDSARFHHGLCCRLSTFCRFFQCNPAADLRVP